MARDAESAEQDRLQFAMDSDTGGRATVGWQGRFIVALAVAWSLYQLWYASPLPFALGWGVLRAAGRNCRIVWGNYLALDLAQADVVYAYLSPLPMSELWRKVRAEMRSGTLFISNTFAVPGIAPWKPCIWTICTARNCMFTGCEGHHGKIP